MPSIPHASSGLAALLALGIAAATPARGAEIAVATLPALGTVVSLSGDVESGDLRRLRTAIEAIRGRVPDDRVFVALDSDGGVAEEGMAMARHLRAAGVGTVVASDARCHSACAKIFFGGYDREAGAPRRIAMPGARIGVHRTRLASENADRENLRGQSINMVFEVLQRRIAQQLEFLNEMGVSPVVQERMFGTSHRTMHILTRAELAGSGVVVMTREGGGVRPPAGLDPRLALPLGPPAVAGAPAPTVPVPASSPPALDLAAVRGGVVQRLDGAPAVVEATWTRLDGCLVAEEAGRLRMQLCLSPTGLYGSLTLSPGAFGHALSLAGSAAAALKLRAGAGERAFPLTPLSRSPTSLVFASTPEGFRNDHVAPSHLAFEIGEAALALRVPDDLREALRAALDQRGLSRRGT